MSDRDLEEVFKNIYAETNEIYNLYRQQLGSNDFGFKILYGPPRLNPPVLFIGDQPGGKNADEKPNERNGWPLHCEFTTETWRLASIMQSMFDSSFLRNCIGINANFFRSPNSKTWNRVPINTRTCLENFCSDRLNYVISILEPKQIVTIGMSVLDNYCVSEPILYGKNNRVLMRRGNIAQWSAVSLLHLSGARMSHEDRLAIAHATLRLANQDAATIVKDETFASAPKSTLKYQPTQLASRNMHDEVRVNYADPKLTIEALDDLTRIGFNNEAFKILHHLNDNLDSFRRWCVSKTTFAKGGNNSLVHERLRYVLNEYRRRGVDDKNSNVFIDLAREALAKIPPIPTGR